MSGRPPTPREEAEALLDGVDWAFEASSEIADMVGRRDLIGPFCGVIEHHERSRHKAADDIEDDAIEVLKAAGWLESPEGALHPPDDPFRPVTDDDFDSLVPCSSLDWGDVTLILCVLTLVALLLAIAFVQL